jgi:hypothetical protein
MKAKPDTAQFTVAKDPQSFIEGGDAPVVTAAFDVPVKVHREQKIFRLRLDLIRWIKKEAYEQSLAAGVRVTETDIVERALARSMSDKK